VSPSRNGAAPGLVGRAAEFLAGGPRHTLEVARAVLNLEGNPSAAASAVFTLLGADPRFRVDGSGIWSLDAERDGPGLPLSRLSFAVVDVETTGGSWNHGHRVTEIAVVPVDGGRPGSVFETLVNPGRPIPPRIQGLTGITDEMVSGAPFFEGVAGRIAEGLEGRVFVAHNVRFDWAFLRRELLEATGDVPALRLLCTIRLGRLLLPGKRSYGLDALTRHFGIRIHRRHRAGGDALATARLLVHLLMEAESRGIADFHALAEALDRKGTLPTRTPPG
jgi:DNA polymerase III epsilon subunit family exonuclease